MKLLNSNLSLQIPSTISGYTCYRSIKSYSFIKVIRQYTREISKLFPIKKGNTSLTIQQYDTPKLTPDNSN